MTHVGHLKRGEKRTRRCRSQRARTRVLLRLYCRAGGAPWRLGLPRHPRLPTRLPSPKSHHSSVSPCNRFVTLRFPFHKNSRTEAQICHRGKGPHSRSFNFRSDSCGFCRGIVTVSFTQPTNVIRHHWHRDCNLKAPAPQHSDQAMPFHAHDKPEPGSPDP